MTRVLATALLTVAALAPGFTGSAPSSLSSPTSRAPLHRHHHQARRATAPFAGGKVGSRNPVTTAAAIAERYWGAVPCGGQVNVVANRPRAPGIDPTADGWSTFDSSLGANNLDAPPSTYTNCTITLAHWQWATWKEIEGDWGLFCLTVTHEMGHLLGQKHSPQPGSVMAPAFTHDSNVPAICSATWLPGRRPAA